MAKRYGLLIDLERCTGCHTCAMACKMENSLERVSGIRVETIGGVGRDAPAGVYPDLGAAYSINPILSDSECSSPPNPEPPSKLSLAWYNGWRLHSLHSTRLIQSEA